MTTPPREQVVQLYNAAVKKRAAMAEDEKGPVPIWLFEEGMAVAYADLETTVKEQAAEIERLKSQVNFWISEQNEQVARTNAEIDASNELRQQLTAVQAENAKLTRDKYPFVHVRFDASTAETESAIRDRLIELGWAPPGELAAAQLHIEQLRGAMLMMLCDSEGKCCMAGSVKDRFIIDTVLSTQPDLSALEAERQRVAEACAKVCENDESGRDSGGYFADTIRAGQWREHL